MKFYKLTVLAVILIISVAACNHSSDKISSIQLEDLKREENNKDFLPQDGKATDTTSPSGKYNPGKFQTAPNSETKQDWDKKIIKTASISLEVKNYNSFNNFLHGDLKKFGAYIAQEEQNQTDYKIEDNVSIKVPVDQFDDLVAALSSQEQKIIEKKITSEDVTGQFVDTKSRLEAKKQVRLRYLDLLKQAKNMEDILNVQNEINGIQENIEAAAGRVEYLSHAAVYSTVNITYFQVLDASKENADQVPYRTKIWQSFKNGWAWVGDVIVGIVSIWPLFLLGFGCWLVYKKLANPKRRNEIKV
jgi:hypothetical protein